MHISYPVSSPRRHGLDSSLALIPSLALVPGSLAPSLAAVIPTGLDSLDDPIHQWFGRARLELLDLEFCAGLHGIVDVLVEKLADWLDRGDVFLQERVDLGHALVAPAIQPEAS